MTDGTTARPPTAGGRMSDRATTQAIHKALVRRYPRDQWCVMQEVNQGTGSASGRRCDFMAVDLWPSRGLKVHGFEVKASRADWLTELKNPAKAETFYKWCDYWWIAAAPGVVKDDLPDGWGLLQLRKDGTLTTKVQPAKIDRGDRGRPWSFVVSMLRSAQQENDSLLSEVKRTAHAAGVDEGKQATGLGARSVERAREKLAEEQERFDAACAAAGVDSTQMRFAYGDHLTEQIKAARDLANDRRALAEAKRQLVTLYKRLGKVLDVEEWGDVA